MQIFFIINISKNNRNKMEKLWQTITSIFKFIKTNLSIILGIVALILGIILMVQCDSNSALKSEISRQKNNILALTDTLHQYKDELGRTIAEKHAFQLTQEELRDSIGLLKKKNTDYLAYINTIVGINDTIVETVYIDRTIKDTTRLDNGVIEVSNQKNFGKSSQELHISIPYYVSDKLYTQEATTNLKMNLFVESWLEKNSKTGETMVMLRSDYPNVNFNSGTGIVATTTPEYEKSMRKTKGIGINVGPQLGVSYDLINKKVVPTIGVGIGIGFNLTPKKLQW